MARYPIQFGKYLLLERVNVGGMAEVFKCKTFGVAGFEKLVALKRILPTMVEDEEFIRMFIDEARISVQLNQPNIVQIYELGRHGEHYYIAMEYVPSRDLRAILDKLRASGTLMPIPLAAFLATKICEGLDYAHRKRDPAGTPMNIIHRDVSPQNVLVGYEGEVKVIDFGIAKAANRASKTQAGVLKGKFGYMSPEQVRGLPIDRRSDIFAVGVLLYEMLTGERLFIGESDFSTLEKVRNAEVVPPTVYNKKITRELEGIVLKALAREAEDRYQWGSDLVEDLQPFLIEERSIFGTKRLAAFMREMYAAEIALEQAKMEEYLKISAPASDEAVANDFAGPEKTFIFEAGAVEQQVASQAQGRKAPLQSTRNPRLPTNTAAMRPPPDEEAATDPRMAAQAAGEDPDFVDHGASNEIDARTIAADFEPPAPSPPPARRSTAPATPAAAAAAGKAPGPSSSFGRVHRAGDPGAPAPGQSGMHAKVPAARDSSTSNPIRRPATAGPPVNTSAARPAAGTPAAANGNGARSATSNPRAAASAPPAGTNPNVRANTGLKAALEDDNGFDPPPGVDPSAATQAVNLADIQNRATEDVPVVPPSTSRGNTLPAPAKGGKGKDAAPPPAAEEPAEDAPAPESTERKEAKGSKAAAKPAKAAKPDKAPAPGGGLKAKLGPTGMAVLFGSGAGLVLLAIGIAVALPRGASTGVIHVEAAADASAPPGAISIKLDGVVKGDKLPLDIPDVPPGTHKVAITGEGIFDLQKAITVAAGQTANVSMEIMAADDGEPAEAPAEKKPESKCAPKDKKCLEKEKKAEAAAARKEEEDKKADEKKAEDKKGDEKKGDEKAAGDEKSDGDEKAEARKEEPKKEEPVARKEEPRKEDPAPKKEEPRKEEPKKAEPVAKKEEPAPRKEEPKKEEPRKAEPVAKKEEPAPKKEEPRKAEPVAKKEEPAPKKEEPKKAAAAGTAELAIGTSPPASVFVDGKDMKVNTPVVASKPLKVPAGKRTLMFITKDGQKFKYNATLEPGPSRLIIPKLGGPPKEGNASFAGN